MNSKPQTKSQDMNDFYGTLIGTGTLRVERLLPGSPKLIWSYLTETDKCKQWLAEIHIEPKEKGGKVTLNFDNDHLTPQKEEAPAEFANSNCAQGGRVTEYSPEKILSYTWSDDDNPSEVIFELTPQGENTLLTLTHRNLSERKGKVLVSSGWHTHLGILLARLNGETPAPFWSRFQKLRAYYEGVID